LPPDSRRKRELRKANSGLGRAALAVFIKRHAAFDPVLLFQDHGSNGQEVGVDGPRDAQAIVQTMTAWLTEQGIEGHDVSKIVPGLGQRLRQLQLQVDRVGCAIVSLHPQIMSEEIAWDAESGDAQTTLFTPAMMEVSENRSGPYFQLALNGITYGRFPVADQFGAPEGSLLRRLSREGYRDRIVLIKS
jgi:hypothetical protein